MMEIQMEGEGIREVERRLELSEPVLRYLTVRAE